jgi:hypothetical protein
MDFNNSFLSPYVEPLYRNISIYMKYVSQIIPNKIVDCDKHLGLIYILIKHVLFSLFAAFTLPLILLTFLSFFRSMLAQKKNMLNFSRFFRCNRKPRREARVGWLLRRKAEFSKMKYVKLFRIAYFPLFSLKA